ncbi:hypothetical protein K402DRAFT_25566 [Aulographum hederae CBS 113979]|uniref:V-type proton ATPase subunit G n=1 Tax=Aulographum hederae CBS 113979 TaxID=1176131 RepID=A0A6G1H5N4_9PEZI|nr:hypothetical protein K402DRAFT_25566 [Aulographum hederae CBS 113979]
MNGWLKSSAHRAGKISRGSLGQLGLALKLINADIPLASSLFDNHPISTHTLLPSSLTKMSAQNSAGIQTLLEAEKEAQKIVQQAREYRTKKVKDARSEAQKEIDEYRKSKEDEFKAFEKEHSSGNKKEEEKSNTETEEKLKEIKELGNKTGSKVVDDLLKAITDVKPAPPSKDQR